MTPYERLSNVYADLCRSQTELYLVYKDADEEQSVTLSLMLNDLDVAIASLEELLDKE